MLAARLHELRGERGIQFTRAFGSMAGCDTFPIFNVHLYADGDEVGEWICAIGIQTHERAVIENAMRRTNPEAPENKRLAKAA